jgi:hypothetical protein
MTDEQGVRLAKKFGMSGLVFLGLVPPIFIAAANISLPQIIHVPLVIIFCVAWVVPALVLLYLAIYAYFRKLKAAEKVALRWCAIYHLCGFLVIGFALGYDAYLDRIEDQARPALRQNRVQSGTL